MTDSNKIVINQTDVDEDAVVETTLVVTEEPNQKPSEEEPKVDDASSVVEDETPRQRTKHSTPPPKRSRVETPPTTYVIDEDDDDDDDDSTQPPATTYYRIEDATDFDWLLKTGEDDKRETIYGSMIWEKWQIIKFYQDCLKLDKKQIDDCFKITRILNDRKVNLLAAKKKLDMGIISVADYFAETVFDYKALIDLLRDLYRCQGELNHFLVFILWPGMKPLFLQGHFGNWMPMEYKHYVENDFRCPATSLITRRRVCYVQSTKVGKDPRIVFGGMPVFTDPVPEPYDKLFTYLMYRDWEMESIFTITSFLK